MQPLPGLSSSIDLIGCQLSLWREDWGWSRQRTKGEQSRTIFKGAARSADRVAETSVTHSPIPCEGLRLAWSPIQPRSGPLPQRIHSHYSEISSPVISGKSSATTPP